MLTLLFASNLIEGVAEHNATLLYFVIPLVASIVGGLISNAFAYFLLVLGQRHDFKMVAMETRLQKHQEAYALWERLYRAIHERNISGLTNEAYKWWSDNNLYLSEPARSAFRASVHGVFSYNDYKGTSEQLPAYGRIVNVFELIETALGLPHMKRPDESQKKAT